MLNIASIGSFSDENCVIPVCWLSILKCWEPLFFSARDNLKINIYIQICTVTTENTVQICIYICNSTHQGAVIWNDIWMCVCMNESFRATVYACVHYNLCGYYVP